MENGEETFKIVVLGESRVGKTSITVRFCKGEFDERQVSTLNAAFLEQKVKINDPTSPNSQA